MCSSSQFMCVLSCSQFVVLFMCVLSCFSKGISQSALPYRRSVPTWLKLTSDDVKEQIYKLAKKGLTPSQIGRSTSRRLQPIIIIIYAPVEGLWPGFENHPSLDQAENQNVFYPI